MRNLRFTLFLVALAFFVVFVFGIELHYLRMESVPFLTKLLLLVLFNLNLVALLTLMFFVGKGLFRIYLERKQEVPGSKFKTRFVAVIVVLTLIPSAILFIVSSGVVTNYLDRLFDPQIKQPIDLSIEVAKSAYEAQRRLVLRHAEALGSGSAAPEQFRVTYLTTLPENASETIRAGFGGKADVEVVSGEAGDIVRAVAPRVPGNGSAGIVVVEAPVDRMLKENAEAIQDAYKNYVMLESLRLPIKTNYLLILGFFMLLIVFMALWVALRISRGITDPIQVLAAATGEVAKGDLNTEIAISRDDEIGLLVRSFNEMVRQLRENKESLHRAYTESNMRRLFIENILENIRSGVLSLDTAGTILTINSAACEILDILPAEVLNRHYSVLFSSLQSEELRETVKGIRIWDFKGMEKEFKATIGSRRVYLRVFITSLGDAENIQGTLVVFDDLTETVRAQKALAWQEVARRMAHEIKNPLTPIQLSTDHMIKKWQNRDEDFGKVFERSTKTIIREVESLKRLVNEFSRFGKMPEIRKTPSLLSSILDGVINLYRDYRDVEISVDMRREEGAVEVDAEQFKRVIINFVDNAIEAMQGQGRIDITVTHDASANRVSMEIADSGPGIKEEDKERLFLPYFSTKKNGTGLGLAIARKIVADHGGYIRIRDNKPQGTVFTIELPIREG